MVRILFLFFILFIACQSPDAADITDAKDNERADSLSIALNSPELKAANAEILADPSSAALYERRARIYMGLRMFDEAANDAKRAIRIDSLRADYHLTLADAYFAANKTRQSRDVLESAVKKFPESVEAHLKMAELYFLVRQYQLAIDHVNMALRIDDHNAKAYYIKGSIYRESGDTTRAVSSLETAVEQDNRFADAFYDLGVIHAARKNPIAFQYYDNAARINPENTDIKYARARLLQDLGDYDAAIARYRQLDSLGQGCPNCCYNIGAIFLEIKKDRKKAIEWFTKAIQEEPVYLEAYFARGYAYSLIGDKQNARKDYQECLRISPNYAPAIEGLNAL